MKIELAMIKILACILDCRAKRTCLKRGFLIIYSFLLALAVSSCLKSDSDIASIIAIEKSPGMMFLFVVKKSSCMFKA